MPVSVESLVTGPFTPNGVTTAFAFTFKAVSASEVIVVDQDGDELSSALYSVALNAGEGGTVTFSVAPLLADYTQLYIVGEPAMTQPADFDNAGPSFNPAALTRAFDRAAIRDLKLQDQVDRSLRVPFGEAGDVLPAATDRASKALFFDSGGAPTVISVDNFAASASAFATAAEASADRAEALALLQGYYPTVAAGAAATVAPATFVSDESGALKVYDADGAELYEPLANVGDLSVTIGSGGTYPTAEAFADWVQGLYVTGTITATLTEHDTAGSMTLNAKNARYFGPGKVILQGAPFGGGQGSYAYDDLPTYSTPVANEAAFAVKRDAIKAYLRTQFNASIVLEGDNDLSGGPGLIGPFHFKRLLVEANGRYSLDNGFLGGHGNSESGEGSQIIEDCAIVGGVWGGIGSQAQMTLAGSRVLFACQISGGPADIINGRIFANAGTAVDCYFPRVTTPFANQPQVAFNIENGSFECGVEKLRVFGPYKHVFRTRGQSYVYAPGVEAHYISHLVTAQDNSFVDVDEINVSNADPNLTAATPGGTQYNTTGNSGQGFLIFAGRGSVVHMNGGTITNSDNLSAYCMADGGTIQTYAKLTAVSSRVTSLSYGEFAAINGGTLHGEFGLTTPVSGGNQWFYVRSGGRIFLVASDGSLNFSQTVNYMRNGSIITVVGNTGGGVIVGGVDMLTTQQAAIADAAATYALSYAAPAGGATVDAESRASLAQLAADVAELAADNATLRVKLNSSLAAARAHKLIAT